MIFAANFKCNHSQSSVYSYIKTLNSLCFSKDFLDSNTLFIFPPFTALQVANELSLVANIGAQNAYPIYNGAITGEIGLEALNALGINTLLIGHSERRSILKESQDDCAKKFSFFASNNFRIIYCVGEPLEIRNKGQVEVEEFLSTQFEGIDTKYDKLIVAYEPIWAIGTGISATLSDIQLAHKFLRTLCKKPLLYGGSVNESNVGKILGIDNVDGVLIGSAALDPNVFYRISQTPPIDTK